MMEKQTSTRDCSYEYTVRRGDSFYLIAHRLGVPLRDLLEANAEVNPARLMVGDVLCIPAAQDTTPGAAEPESPPAGESAPSADAEADPEDLLDRPALDGIPDTSGPAQDEPDLTSAPSATGDTVPTPDEAGDSAAPAPEETIPMARSTVPDLQCSTGAAHAIADGETAADIQVAAGLNLHTLREANPGLDLEALVPGQVLCVPQENIPCPIRPTYTLRRDDTLESAALHLDLSISALLRANPCLAPGDFRPGVIICLPET